MCKKWYQVENGIWTIYLGNEEIILWLSPDNVKPAIEETERWFGELGLGTDVELEFGKIFEKAEVFLESKALENGRMMRFADEL